MYLLVDACVGLHADTRRSDNVDKNISTNTSVSHVTHLLPLPKKRMLPIPCREETGSRLPPLRLPAIQGGFSNAGARTPTTWTAASTVVHRRPVHRRTGNGKPRCSAPQVHEKPSPISASTPGRRRGDARASSLMYLKLDRSAMIPHRRHTVSAKTSQFNSTNWRTTSTWVTSAGTGSARSFQVLWEAVVLSQNKREQALSGL